MIGRGINPKPFLLIPPVLIVGLADLKLCGRVFMLNEGALQTNVDERDTIFDVSKNSAKSTRQIAFSPAAFGGAGKPSPR
jgi:hypothetical protein